MRIRILFMAGLFILGCKPKITGDNVKFLNGYWEIDKVEFPNGQTKEYTISTTIDYIELENNKGFRKKVQPQLNGSYQTSDDAELFVIEQNEGIFLMIYEKGLGQWEETLVSLEENSFSVKNEDGKIYHYKRYEPLNLNL